jgi:hypothetical protein
MKDKLYLADFTYVEPVTGTYKEAFDFKVEAESKQDALRQIKNWFKTHGTIRIMKEG